MANIYIVENGRQMTKSYKSEVKQDPITKEYYFQLDPNTLSQMGWVADDILLWEDQKDGTFVITKKE
jgi:hypothetical protein